MLKPVGAALVLAAAFWGGYSQVLRLKTRAELLRRLKESLERMEAELLFRAAPLTRVFRWLAEGERDGVKDFYLQWASRVEEGCGCRGQELDELAVRHLSLLTQEERRVFLTLAETLGRYDLPAQKAALEEAITRLTEQTETAEREKSRLGRLSMTLSLSVGVMVVLVCL